MDPQPGHTSNRALLPVGNGPCPLTTTNSCCTRLCDNNAWWCNGSGLSKECWLKCWVAAICNPVRLHACIVRAANSLPQQRLLEARLQLPGPAQVGGLQALHQTPAGSWLRIQGALQKLHQLWVQAVTVIVTSWEPPGEVTLGPCCVIHQALRQPVVKFGQPKAGSCRRGRTMQYYMVQLTFLAYIGLCCERAAHMEKPDGITGILHSCDTASLQTGCAPGVPPSTN